MAEVPQPLAPLDGRAAEIGATIGDARQRDLFERVLARVPPSAHRALQEKYREAISTSDPGFIYKYLDIAFWAKDKVAKVFAMGLADRADLRILDLGVGAGHFLAVCQVLGHPGVGLDVEVPLYIDLCELMRVDRRTCRINPREALPDLGRFDLVTAFQIKFDALGTDREGRYFYWTLDDWAFLLEDVSRNVMKYPGVLRLELNSRVIADGTREQFFDVLEMFQSAGGKVDETASSATFRVEEPLTVTPPNRPSPGYQPRRALA
jgi:hypothetical protein